MNTNSGFAGIAVLLVALGIIALGGGAYVAMNPEVLKAPEEKTQMEAMNGTETTEGSAQAERKGKEKWIELDSMNSISWKFTTMGERENIPYTKVTAVVDGKSYDAGEYQGSCSEVGATGGVDGKGLLAGELSAVQCWYAGGGDEIGVFAHEDGGYQIMVGTLEEPIEGGAGFRGDFKIKTDIRL